MTPTPAAASDEPHAPPAADLAAGSNGVFRVGVLHLWSVTRRPLPANATSEALSAIRNPAEWGLSLPAGQDHAANPNAAVTGQDCYPRVAQPSGPTTAHWQP